MMSSLLIGVSQTDPPDEDVAKFAATDRSNSNGLRYAAANAGADGA